jgi:hypothetical protein
MHGLPETECVVGPNGLGIVLQAVGDTYCKHRHTGIMHARLRRERAAQEGGATMPSHGMRARTANDMLPT